MKNIWGIKMLKGNFSNTTKYYMNWLDFLPLQKKDSFMFLTQLNFFNEIWIKGKVINFDIFEFV